MKYFILIFLLYIVPSIIAFKLIYKETRDTYPEPTLYNLLFEDGNILWMFFPIWNWTTLFIIGTSRLTEWSKKIKI